MFAQSPFFLTFFQLTFNITTQNIKLEKNLDLVVGAGRDAQGKVKQIWSFADLTSPK